MSKHTKLPWSIRRRHGESSIIISSEGTPIVATVPLRDVSINEQDANARLIAAAPEMLDALETAEHQLAEQHVQISRILQLLDNHEVRAALHHQAIAINSVKSAIAKATE